MEIIPNTLNAMKKNSALNDTDLRILRQLQRNVTIPLERLAKRVGISKSAVWNRIQRMRADGVIRREVALLDPGKVGIGETFFVAIRTSRHTIGWLEKFSAAIQEMPEIMEAHRLAGEMDYLLKVQVPTTKDFDLFYKNLISRVELFDVTSNLSMETMKEKTDLPF
jgi:Lrp/AsnC family transcriptional regulator